MAEHENLTKKEVAKLLRVTTRTVENYVKTGRLAAPVRPMGRPLWARAYIESLLSAQKGEQRAAA